MAPVITHTFVFNLKFSFVETPTIASHTSGARFSTNDGTDITFTCLADGVPAPSISFSYKGQAITGDPRPMTSNSTVLDRFFLHNETVSMMSSGVLRVSRMLTLYDVVPEDAGMFVCFASVNVPGIMASTNESFILRVFRKFVCCVMLIC